MPIIEDNGDVLLAADTGKDGNGRLVFSTGGFERAGINADGTGTGLLGGSQPDIMVVANGSGGSRAISLTSSLTISGTTNGTSATVFQNAFNALALQNGGKGGMVAFSGQHTWASPVTMYPGTALVGQGPLGNKTVQDTGARIKSTYNGATLVITGVAAGSNNYFPYLSNFTMYGDNSGSSPLQDLIRLDNSGGASINDTLMSYVTLFNAGRHGIIMDTTSTLTKLFINNCYLEGSIGNGLTANGGVFAALQACYIQGSTGWGIQTAGPSLYVSQINFNQNGAGGVDVGTSATDVIAMLNAFADNGSNTSLNAQLLLDGNVQNATIIGNTFRDSRGASAVQYHCRVSRSGWCKSGAITGNSFDANAQVAPFQANYNALNKLNVVGNSGYNDTQGKIASSFSTTHIGIEGTSAAPTASTDYTVCGPALTAVISGGTGVSMTIKDPKANTVQSSLTSFTGRLEPGYVINFGAFSVAPTIYIGVV